MAQAMASMTGLSQGVQLPAGPRRAGGRSRLAVVRADAAAADVQTGRRAVLGLVATGIAGGALAQAALAEAAKPIKLGPPPPPSGGLRKCSIINLSNFERVMRYYCKFGIEIL